MATGMPSPDGGGATVRAGIDAVALAQDAELAEPTFEEFFGYPADADVMPSRREAP